MNLYPTDCTFQGRRIWIQDDDDSKIDYMNYRATVSPLQISVNSNLPKAMPIELKGTSDGKDHSDSTDRA